MGKEGGFGKFLRVVSLGAFASTAAMGANEVAREAEAPVKRSIESVEPGIKQTSAVVAENSKADTAAIEALKERLNPSKEPEILGSAEFGDREIVHRDLQQPEENTIGDEEFGDREIVEGIPGK